MNINKRPIKKKIKGKIFFVGLIFLFVGLFTTAVGAVFLMVSDNTLSLAPAAELSHAQEYKDIYEATNIDWVDMMVYDTVKYDNDFEKVDANETAWEFITVDYELIEHVKVKLADGTVTYRWKTRETGHLKDKDQIYDFMRKDLKNAASNIKVAVKRLNDHNGREFRVRKGGENRTFKYIIKINILDLKDVTDDFTEEQNEWVDILITENFVPEMFGEMFDLPDFIPDHIDVMEDDFFAWPTPTLHTITSGYGRRVHPVTGEVTFHYGIDISGPSSRGEPIIAMADGVVFQTNYTQGAAGNNIRIKHIDKDGNEWQTRYCHLDKIKANIGKKVRKGDLIGTVGSTGRVTGPHLHLEMKFAGQLIDPYKYFTDTSMGSSD